MIINYAKAKFICECCGQVFNKIRPEQEAEEEVNKLFPGLLKNERAVVCHECFIEIMEFNEPGQKRYEN